MLKFGIEFDCTRLYGVFSVNSGVKVVTCKSAECRLDCLLSDVLSFWQQKSAAFNVSRHQTNAPETGSRNQRHKFDDTFRRQFFVPMRDF